MISQLHVKYPHIKFLGSDGWGQSTWSFLQGYNIPSSVNAISVRVGKSNTEIEDYFDIYSLSFEWKNELLNPPYGAYAAIHFINKMTENLCEIKPKKKMIL